MMLFVIGILAFGGLTTTAYAQGDEKVRYGYTMKDIQELLNENNALSSTDTRDLQIYSQNGIMNTIEVPEEEEESSTQSLIQPMAAPSFTTQTLIDSGRGDSQSIVVMIMGDGFTSTQQPTFITAATNITNDLVGQYPMSLFKDYFNIYAIEVISSESGVSNDINGFNWWTNNPSNVNNYFGSRFYFDAHIFNPTGTERSLYISKESKVKALERTNTVMSMVVCNSTRWGGAAGKYAVSSLASGYENIAAHEFGHAFGDLEDEYWYSGEKFRTSEAANKSKSTTKWSQWTDNTSTGIYRIGTHRFSSTTSDTAYSWYKPHTSCKMQFSTSAFCAVCSEELAQKMAAKTAAAFTTTDLANNYIRIEKMNLAYQGHFTIPNKWNGRFVTEIGTSAFVSRNGVSRVTIPTTVTSIGTSAFSGLTNLTQVSFGTSPTLQTIGNSAFSGCTALSQISMPASVTSIGSSAFNNTNNALIYLDGRTSVPSSFDTNWNSSGNPVYLNGRLCMHTSKTTIEINASQHGDLCNSCRTLTNIENHKKYTNNGWEYCYDCPYSRNLYPHTHVYGAPYIPTTPIHGMERHLATCSCGDSIIRPCLAIAPPPGGIAYCHYCGQEMGSGFILTMDQFLDIIASYEYN